MLSAKIHTLSLFGFTLCSDSSLSLDSSLCSTLFISALTPSDPSKAADPHHTPYTVRHHYLQLGRWKMASTEQCPNDPVSDGQTEECVPRRVFSEDSSRKSILLVLLSWKSTASRRAVDWAALANGIFEIRFEIKARELIKWLIEIDCTINTFSQ